MAENKRDIEKRKKRIRGTLALVGILIVFLLIGFYAGFIFGVHYTAKSFAEAVAFVISNSDIHMDVNMTLNQTQMMDYLIDKMGINDTATKKEYVPPCNMDPNVPRGETSSRCIAQQEVKEK